MSKNNDAYQLLKSAVKNPDSDWNYYVHEVPASAFFYIPHERWNYLMKKQHKRRFKNLKWTNVIAKGIRSFYPHCSFGFIRHTVKDWFTKEGTTIQV